MQHVVFVMPAWGRLPVSRVVFAQRRRAMDELINAGVRASCVVVTDDGNAELATELGFHVVDHPNSFLSDRWNAGYERAGELGATHAMPIGSDSLLDPALIARWLSVVDDDAAAPDARRVSWTRFYAVVHPTGRRRVDCHVMRGGGGGMMLPGALLERVGWRPVTPGLKRGCDHSTLSSLSRHGAKLRRVDAHQLAVVALQSRVQITSYAALQSGWGVHEEFERPLSQLEDVYGEQVTSDVKALYRDHRVRP